jgi:PTH1 family peptidyl-tRNA hydrolase
MNRSGLSIRQLSDFFKIAPGEILVAHDELDLPVGSVRLKHSAAATAATTVARHHRAHRRGLLAPALGIGHPGNKADVIDYVLTRAPRARRI